MNAPLPTADGTAVTVSVSTGVQPAPGLVLPANYMYPGLVLRMTAHGRFSTTATPTLTFQPAWGGLALATSGAITLGSGVTNLPWRVEGQISCRAIGSGTNGSLFFAGLLYLGTSTTAQTTSFIPATAPAATGVDTTTAKAIDLYVTFSTTAAANTLTCHQFLVEALD